MGESAYTIQIMHLLYIILPILTVSSIFTNLSCKENYFNWFIYAKQTLGCWSESEVLFYPEFTCYPLHSSSPCINGSRLVFSNSDCAETTCRPYKDSSGSPCSYPDISHEGECKDPGDATACGSILGRRIVPDLFGDYTCQCDRSIGFVEYGGSCQVEYLQGPCEKREQLVMMEKEVQCVKNTCSGGNVTWSNEECYPFTDLTKVLPIKLTTEEIAFVNGNYNLASLEPFSVGTFTNCANKDSNGDCLEKVKLPEVKKQEDEDFLFLRSELFPEINENNMNGI